MTRPATKPLPRPAIAVMAKLMQLHHATHPERVGRLFGVTPTYVRKVWSETPLEAQATLAEVAECAHLRELIRQGLIAPNPNRHPVDRDPTDAWENAVQKIYEENIRNGEKEREMKNTLSSQTR